MTRKQTLVIISAIVFIGIVSPYAWSYYWPQEHRLAVAAIEQFGGEVSVKRRFVLIVPVYRFTTANLSDSQAGDSEMVHLRGLVNLKKLILDNTGISDTGLSHLHEMAGLEFISLHNTQVSAAGVEDLRQSLPQTRIVK